MAGELTLRVRNDTAELARVAAALEAFAAEHGLGDKDVFDVTLALDEVLTNVIWYAFDGGAEQWIDVRVTLGGGDLEVEVRDGGRAFDPLSVPAVDLALERPAEEREIGGLGMHLVRHAMHALEYRRENDRNVLTMRRRVTREEG